MPESVIDVSALTKRFGTVAAVDALSFSVARGATVALLGGNGAGKTTTISMLLGLLLPTSGTVAVLGCDMRRNRRRALSRINFSSPYVDLPHRLTVRENLQVYGMLYGLADMNGRIDELAGDLHLRVFSTGRWETFGGAEDAGRARQGAAQPAGGAAAGRADRPRSIPIRPTGCAAISRPISAPRVRQSCWLRTTWAKWSGMCAQVLMMRRGQIVDRGTPAELLSRFGRQTLEEVFLDIARNRRQPDVPSGHASGHSAPTPTTEEALE